MVYFFCFLKFGELTTKEHLFYLLNLSNCARLLQLNNLDKEIHQPINRDLEFPLHFLLQLRLYLRLSDFLFQNELRKLLKRVAFWLTVPIDCSKQFRSYFSQVQDENRQLQQIILQLLFFYSFSTSRSFALIFNIPAIS